MPASESSRRSSFGTRPSPGGRERGAPRGLRWNPVVRYVIAAIATLVIAYLLPRSAVHDQQYEIGSIWPGDSLRAPFAFPLYKEESRYQKELEQAADSALPVFVPTGATAMLVRGTLDSLVAEIINAQERPIFLSQSAWESMQGLAPGVRTARLQPLIGQLAVSANQLYRVGTIDRSKSSLRKSRVMIRRSDAIEEAVAVASLYDSASATTFALHGAGPAVNAAQQHLLSDLWIRAYRPQYRFDATLTARAIENARNAVTRSLGVVAENELIIARDERITENTRLKLTSFQRSIQQQEIEEKPFLQFAGNLIQIGGLMALIMLYLLHFRRRIFYDNLQLGILFSLLVLLSLVSYASIAMQSSLPLAYLIPMPLLAMLLVILFDSRTAFYVSATSCFVIAGIRGSDYSVALACLAAGVLAIYAVRDIKSRTQLFRAILYSMIGYTLAILALGLGRGELFSGMELKLAFAAINSIISPVLTFAIILLLENVFGIATDLKLLEYDNLNHALLRALADKAPGTYQHTLTIARLAESAATAIGANALLAKVGAYFHDVGKIGRAEYFVENQMGMGNKHDKIKPEKSAKIIRDHVLEGVELAREYHLPQRIVDFIPMHHGTTPIKFFLDKARETNGELDESLFHYPGPLPHSRETAIVMLADAVEATTRALPNPVPKVIEETVDRVIKKRFSEGQLDECELTLADLGKIKAAFVKNLVGMSHPRIQYQGDEPAKAKKAEPLIPYVDDAFGDTGRPAVAEKDGKGGDEGVAQ